MDDKPSKDGCEITLLTDSEAFCSIAFNPSLSSSLWSATKFISTCLLTSLRIFSNFPESIFKDPDGKSELLISSANFNARTLFSSE